MKAMRNTSYWLLAGFLFIALSNVQCDKESKDIDKELYDMSKSAEGFTWYKLSDELLDKSPESGHSYPFLRTRYNDIAASQLDENGKILAGGTFGEGSLVVKELYSNSTTLERYAILYKKSDSEYADANGWVWAYIDFDGTVVGSAVNKGVGCIDCHSQEGNIDYMLMNKFSP